MVCTSMLLLKFDLIIESIHWVYLMSNTFNSFVQVPGMEGWFSFNLYYENSLAFYEFQNLFTQLANG